MTETANGKKVFASFFKKKRFLTLFYACTAASINQVSGSFLKKTKKLLSTVALAKVARVKLEDEMAQACEAHEAYLATLEALVMPSEPLRRV